MSTKDLQNYLELREEIITLELKLHETIREIDHLKKSITTIISTYTHDTNIVILNTDIKK